MVAYRARLDDVLLPKGKKVEASEKIPVKIPGAVMPDGKTLRTELDVSADGKAEWDKMLKKFESDIQAAVQPLLAVLNARQENSPPAPGRKGSRSSGSSDGASEDASESSDASDETAGEEASAESRAPYSYGGQSA